MRVVLNICPLVAGLSHLAQVSSRVSHVVAGVRIPSPVDRIILPSVFISCLFFSCLWVLGCLLATVDNAAVSLGVEIPVGAPPVTSGHEPRSGSAGACCGSAFAFLRSHHTVSHGDALLFTAPSVPCRLGSEPRGAAPELVQGRAPAQGRARPSGLPRLCLRPGISHWIK